MQSIDVSLQGQSAGRKGLEIDLEGYTEKNKHRVVINISYNTDFLAIASLDDCNSYKIFLFLISLFHAHAAFRGNFLNHNSDQVTYLLRIFL